MLFKREVSMRKMVKANLVLVYSTKLVTLKTVGFINSHTDSEKPKVGDDFSKKSLELWAQDESDACYTTLTYKSGSAKVVSIDKSKDDMTIKFDNLKMAGGEYSYTFNGTATVDFNFAR